MVGSAATSAAGTDVLRLEVLDLQDTPMGEISLRRRFDPVLDQDVFEVRLGEEYLMSSAFTASEIELSRAGLAMLDGTGLDVLVGGLGLGYTAVAALEDPRVASVTVVDGLEQVIDWHRRELLPESARLVRDPRTRLVHGDFFAAVAGRTDVPGVSDTVFDAVLLDVDHSPRHVLHESHAPFYTVDGLTRMRERLRPGGALGVWSDDPPDEEFMGRLGEVYTDVAGRVVTFPNPYTRGESSCSVHLARRAQG